MARVTGIGGLFFRSQDPGALMAWYAQWFGMPTDGAPWQQEAGATVFAPFKATTDYFAPERQWMLNLRVEGLTDMIAAMKAAGIAVETRAEWDGDGSYGHFARVHDPDGNPIELWEPPQG
jgi:predicted enzyme related to lactoylglutathione lyase